MSLKVELDGTITVRCSFPDTAGDCGLVCGESSGIGSRVRLRAGEQILAVRPSPTQKRNVLKEKKSGKRVKERCCYYAGLMGVSYGSITVREQKRAGELRCKGKPEF